MIPGIVKVGYFDCSYMPDLHLPVWPEEIYTGIVTYVELVEPGSVSVEHKFSALGSDVKSKLEFASSEEIPVSGRLAFLIEDAGGRKYIVGNCLPHCGVISKSAQINLPSGKASVNYYSFSVPAPLYEVF